jgi:hypothetical protein
MGLDYVEIKIEIESTFEIDCSRFRYVMPFDLISADDLLENVWQTLQGNEAAWTDVDADWLLKQIVPQRQWVDDFLKSFSTPMWWWKSDRLDRRIAPERRFEAWAEIERQLGRRLTTLGYAPDVDGPQFPDYCSTVSRLTGMLAREWIKQHEPYRFRWRPSSTAAPAPVRSAFEKMVRQRFKRRHAAPFLLHSSLSADATQVRDWGREEVWHELQRILMDNLNLPLEEVQADATLICDLKMS